MREDEPSRVKVLFDDGVCEEVLVRFVGECRCMLEQTPMASTTTARLGDVIEFEPSDGIARMTRIAEASRFETVTWVVPPDETGPVTRRALETVIARCGGRIEDAFGGTVLVHVPADERKAIESVIKSLRESSGEPRA